MLIQEGTARRIESREGVAEDCCMLSILLAVPSCFNSFWHGVIPTSYFDFFFLFHSLFSAISTAETQ